MREGSNKNKKTQCFLEWKVGGLKHLDHIQLHDEEKKNLTSVDVMFKTDRARISSLE
jgi:hypothetical protein